MTQRLLSALVALGMLGACSQSGANTQVMVTVDAEDGVRDVARQVLVHVYGGPHGAAQETLPLVQEYPIAVPPHNGWPLVIALAPLDRDPTRIYRVEAIAFDVAEPIATTVPVATVRAISGYVPGQTVLLRLLLQDDCLGHECTDINTTCDHGTCQTAVVDPLTLPPFGSDGGAFPDGHRPDAGDLVDSSVDGGPTCTTASCDDGHACTVDFCAVDGCDHMGVDALCDDHNPCTDDHCDAASGDGCSHVANTVGCDDGNYCNGFDTCIDSACNGHMGDPCDGLSCDEALDRCTGCSAADPCPTPIEGPFSGCTYASACASTGTQTRTVRTFTCNASNVCDQMDAPDTASCDPRSTEGDTCMPTTCDPEGACVGATTCALIGTAARTCYDHTCASDSCVQMPRSSPVSCPRATNGNACDDGNACTMPDTCAGGICIGSGMCDSGVDSGLDSGMDASSSDAGRDSGGGGGGDAGDGSAGDGSTGSDGGFIDSGSVFDSDGGVAFDSHLVINEVDYDLPGTDTAEFIEIYNPGSSWVTLDGLALVVVGTGTEYGRATLTGSLAPFAYAVVRPTSSGVSASFVLSASALVDSGGAIVIWDIATRSAIDAISYEGDTTSATILAPGAMSGVNLVEGSGTFFAQDTGLNPSTLCRLPNGSDTNDRSDDWTACTGPTLAGANL